MKVSVFRRRSLYFRPWTLHWSYAHKGGGPILRGEPRLRNVNGFMVSLPRRQVWLEFRRTARSAVSR